MKRKIVENRSKFLKTNLLSITKKLKQRDTSALFALRLSNLIDFKLHSTNMTTSPVAENEEGRKKKIFVFILSVSFGFIKSDFFIKINLIDFVFFSSLIFVFRSCQHYEALWRIETFQ